jgi:predicted nucleotidyltransferase
MPSNKTAGPSTIPHEDAPARVLRFLWKSRAEWSGREIARKVGLSAPSCHEALKKLDACGLVLLRRVSNMHLYMINSDSYLVKNAFIPAFEAQEAMPDQINTLIKKTLAGSPKDGILAIAIFGSMARKTARLESDLDVLIVLQGKENMKRLEPRIENLRALLFRRFNLSLSPYVQTVSELRQKHERKLPLIQEILKDGHLIFGKDLKELLP